MGEKVKQGRPAKSPPVVDGAASKRAAKIAKEYPDSKLRSCYCEKKRRSLIKRAGIDLGCCDADGFVKYDESEVSGYPAKDKAMLLGYIREKQNVLCVEKGIQSIPDTRTRIVAEKTILERMSCANVADELQIPLRTVFREKARAIQWIAYYQYQMEKKRAKQE